MGRRDRERFQQTGKVFRGGSMVDVKGIPEKTHERMQNVGESALQAMSTGNQVKVLRDSLYQGRLSPGKLRRTLEANAPKEMRKGADKLRKKNKPVTVDALLEEYRRDMAFKALAEEVGLPESYFIALAERECNSGQ